MRRAILAIGVLGALALPVAADAACPAPKHLSFTRKAGASAGRLTWQPAARAPRGTRYRVSRDRRVIGQTAGVHMRVRVSVGRSYWLVVRPVTPRGRLLLCWGQLRQRVRYVLPTAPRDLVVTGATRAAAHLSWSPGHRGDGRVGAYRVTRDGLTYKQTHATSMDVPIANDRTYAFRVKTVDVHGRLSRATPPVTIATGHEPPTAPGSVIASEITDSELT